MHASGRGQIARCMGEPCRQVLLIASRLLDQPEGSADSAEKTESTARRTCRSTRVTAVRFPKYLVSAAVCAYKTSRQFPRLYSAAPMSAGCPAFGGCRKRISGLPRFRGTKAGRPHQPGAWIPRGKRPPRTYATSLRMRGRENGRHRHPADCRSRAAKAWPAPHNACTARARPGEWAQSDSDRAAGTARQQRSSIGTRSGRSARRRSRQWRRSRWSWASTRRVRAIGRPRQGSTRAKIG